MAACQDTKDFLLTLLDIVEDLGPGGIQSLCVKGGSECTIDDKQFTDQIRKSREAIKNMGCKA